jgi:hypothetical protein
MKCALVPLAAICDAPTVLAATGVLDFALELVAQLMGSGAPREIGAQLQRDGTGQ